jgi:Zn finger protein HypA/HybF involved in hydrogenase expression
VNIAKAMKDVQDATLIQGKVFELQRAIIDTQQSVFSANEERAALIEKISSLEIEISRLNDWNIEKAKYEFTKVNSIGVYAYSRKSLPDDTEPHHFICANCYQQGQKSVLQASHRTAMAKRIHICPRCKTELTFGSVQSPTPRFEADYNPFKGA